MCDVCNDKGVVYTDINGVTFPVVCKCPPTQEELWQCISDVCKAVTNKPMYAFDPKDVKWIYYI